MLVDIGIFRDLYTYIYFFYFVVGLRGRNYHKYGRSRTWELIRSSFFLHSCCSLLTSQLCERSRIRWLPCGSFVLYTKATFLTCYKLRYYNFCRQCCPSRYVDLSAWYCFFLLRDEEQCPSDCILCPSRWYMRYIGDLHHLILPAVINDYCYWLHLRYGCICWK